MMKQASGYLKMQKYPEAFVIAAVNIMKAKALKGKKIADIMRRSKSLDCGFIGIFTAKDFTEEYLHENAKNEA